MIKVSPSVLTADFLELSGAIAQLESAGADMLHLDVMDGIFVPNISFGVPVIQSIKRHTRLPLDVHLMIDRPHRYIKEFAPVSDWLGIHYEAGSPVPETLREIRSLGCRPCITIKPATPASAIFPLLDLVDMVLVMSVEPGFGGQAFMPSALDKLRELRKECGRRGLPVDLQVDGGINLETAAEAVRAGANVLVAGNFLFSADDMAGMVRKLKSAGSGQIKEPG